MLPLPPDFVASVRRAIDSPPAGVDPWFRSYYADLGNPLGLSTYLRAKEQLLELAGGPRAVRGATVVDVGSGFGMVSNVMAALGAARVFSLELFAPMAASHRLVLERHFPDLRGRVHLARGDAAAMPLRSASVDLLLSIEAISHYYDVDGFLDECARVVRPGGTLVISDGNNGANPSLRRFTERLWVRYESGPAGPFGDRVVGETMEQRRAALIARRFPELDPARIEALARSTSGMVRAEIERAVAAHLAGGPAPVSRYAFGTLPRDPEWGYVLEALFDPPELAARLARRGFRARAVPHYGGARNDALLALNRALRRVPSFRFARAFRIVATRA